MRLRKSFWLVPLLVLSCVFFLAASIPNVPTGTWQNWNAMGDVRSGAAAVLLQDGRVLIIGGSNANGPVASADLFGTDGVFSAAATMQTPRSGHTATVLSDGRVLVTGGTTSSGGAVNTAEIYDPSADSWSASVTMVDARAGHTASLLSDGRVLLAGGHDSAGNALSSLEVFDPASGTFLSAGAMSLPRMNHAAATLTDGRVLIIGGTANGTNALASIDIYDPSAGTVSAGPNLSTPRMAATATTTLDGKVAVIGGSNGSQDLASAEFFDPATGQIALSVSNLATPRSGHSAFLLPKNNAILVLGGSSAGTDLNSAELYYPWADSFQSTGVMSVARPGLVGSASDLDGRFLAAGGTNLASTELYGFATVKTDAADYPPGSTVTITGSGWRPGETVTLTLVESPLIDTHGPYNVVADGNGNVLDSSFVTDDHDLSIRFYLTAVGSQSGVQAQNTFTDGNGTVTGTVKSSATGNPAISGASVTCTSGCNQGPVTTNGSGAYSLGVSFSGNGPATVTITASATGFNSANLPVTILNNGQTVSNQNFLLNPVSAANSTVVASPTSVTADGTSTSTITVTLEDTASTPVSGKAISLTAGSGSSTITTVSGTTNASGQTTFTVKDTVAQTVTYTARDATDSINITQTATVTFTAGAATQLVITGSTSQTAGTTNNLTITAKDAGGNVATSYTGDKSLTFSGANHSTNPVTNPTVADKNGTAMPFGTVTTITFVSGVANVSGSSNGVMTLFKAETAVVAVTDGSISAAGANRLTVTVSSENFAQFALSLTSPQTNAVAFTGTNTLTAQDAFGNPVTTFNASTDNVTIVANAPLTGTVSGLGSGANNVLNQAGDFSSGVANLTTLGMKYTGNATAGTFTATSNTGKTVTSGSVTIDGGALNHFLVEKSGGGTIGTQTAGTAFNIIVTAQDANNNTVTSFTANGNKVTLTSTGTLVGAPITTVAFTNGVLSSQSVTITNTGSFTITATGIGGNSGVTGTSNPFTVNPGVANKLTFAQQPTNALINATITPAVTVQIQDQFGNLRSGDTNSIGIAILNDPGSGTLSGTTPVSAVGGVATFGDLSINKAGVGYTLRATSAGLASATSNAFTINNPAPTLTSIAPTSGNLNQTLNVVFTGTNFISGVSSVNVGANITVNTTSVDNANQITANISIGAGAAVGPRNFSVTNNGPGGGTSGNQTFTVIADSTPPVVTVSFPTPDGSHGWFKTSPVMGSVTADDTTTGGSNISVISCSGATVGTITGLGTKTASAPLTISADGSYNVSCTATDSASNTGASAGSTTMPVVVRLDAAPPSLSASRLTPANGNGWNNTDVGVRFTCTDATSLVASVTASGAASGSSTTGPLDVSVTSEGSGQSVNGACTDNAGNSATPASVNNINIDKTAPSASATPSPGANANGWNNTNVTVQFSGTDSLSGIDSCDADVVLSAEAAGQSASGLCTDKAGNVSATATASGINIDKTKPTANAAPSPAPNANGWNKTEVTVTFSGSDSLSGIDFCTSPSILGSEGAGQSASGTCTDKAGNVSDAATASGINIDKTAPSLSGTPSPAANANGWNNTDVSVAFTCTDSLSGVDTAPVSPQVVSTESAGQSRSASCTDKAGNSANASVNNINIDKTAPSASATPSPGANANGWNNTNVTVQFSGTDSLSGIDSCDADVVLSAEAAGQSASGHCTDKAGNVSATATASGINIDKTPPVISFVSRTPANGNGWNNTDVMVNWSCSDSLSGPVSVSLSNTVSTEGQNQSSSQTCTDKAGNTASNTQSGINIDRTPPSITASRAPLANANGWNNMDVLASYSASDSLSGLDSAASGNFTFSSEAAGQSHTFTVYDKAGNSATATIDNVNIDKTAPTITFVGRTAANSYGWNNTDVMVNWSCSDSLSGPVSTSLSNTVSTEGQNQSSSQTCTDKAGNTASNTQSGINIDKTPPTLSPSVSPNPVLLNGSATASAGASDSLSGIATQSCGALVLNSVGSKNVSCTATDKAGNSSTAPTNYSVIYSTGACLGSPGHAILQPINFTGDSVFPRKQGSTVPAKFRVCDANGVSIGTPGVVSDFRIVQIVNGTATSVDEAVDSTTPDTAFRWSGDQWIYNISTKNLSAGNTYFFRIFLNDGTNIDFDFGLK